MSAWIRRTAPFLSARKSSSPLVSTPSREINAFSSRSPRWRNATSLGTAAPMADATPPAAALSVALSSSPSSRSIESANLTHASTSDRHRSVASCAAVAPSPAVPSPPRVTSRSRVSTEDAWWRWRSALICSICASCATRARSRLDSSPSTSMSLWPGRTPSLARVPVGDLSLPRKSSRLVVTSTGSAYAARHAASLASCQVVVSGFTAISTMSCGLRDSTATLSCHCAAMAPSGAAARPWVARRDV
mmetsp:Transcript_12770/g.51334  ORF Transcript_12770/g.51334 Transcript_12770/m.51334 type:complete len:247 (-) Transcript_12770:73-813(-)